MIDIFQSELTLLDAELVQLQELMESKRQEQTLLKELGFEANSTIAAIAKLKEKVEVVKSDAIASLKSAVLNLFNDGGDDGGNQPTDPTPDPAGLGVAGSDDDDILVLNGETDECSTTDDPQEDSGEEVIIYHPENGAIAWIANPESSDEKFTVFLGFARKAVAKSWQRFVEPMATAVELGEAEILEGFKWELYCYGLSMGQISQLAECDFTKKHHAEIGTATPPETFKKFQPIAIEIGTKFTRLLTPSEVFEATSLVSNGTFFAKSTLTGDRQLFNINDVDLLFGLPEGKPKYAVVLLPDDEWHGEKLQIFAESEIGLTLRTPKGENCWYKRDVLEIIAEAISTHPITQRPNLVQPAFGSAPGGLLEVENESITKRLLGLETAGVISVGDTVRITGDRFPQFFEQVGTVEGIASNNSETPITVRTPRGIKSYHRSELKLESDIKIGDRALS